MSPLLISAGADDSICLCNTSDEKSKDNLLFRYIKIDDGVKETPTSIDWLPSSVQHFAASYARNLLTLNDSQSGKIVSTNQIPVYENLPFINQQINSINCNPTIDMMVALGTESKDLRIMDIGQKFKQIAHVPNAHNDSISSVTFSSSGLVLYSGCHSGVLKSWDVRNFQQPLSETIVCNKKYDEGILKLNLHP